MNSTNTQMYGKTVMMSRWSFRAILTVAFILVAGLTGFVSAQMVGPNPQGEGRPVIGVEHEGPIKVVFQITSDDMQHGVGKGLFILRNLYEGYIEAGIDPDRLDIRAVYHGDAADHLLTDEAWNRWRDETGGNPNTDLLAELASLGISVELCDSRRTINGWSKDDVHPDVLLAANAYERLFDLQLQGYAYVRL